MPEVDPAAINTNAWSDITTWQVFLALYLISIVIVAFSFLTAHALIPSLVSSGHLPKQLLKLRPPMYFGAVVFIGVAVVLMAITVQNTLLLEDLYNRFWF